MILVLDVLEDYYFEVNGAKTCTYIRSECMWHIIAHKPGHQFLQKYVQPSSSREVAWKDRPYLLKDFTRPSFGLPLVSQLMKIDSAVVLNGGKTPTPTIVMNADMSPPSRNRSRQSTPTRHYAHHCRLNRGFSDTQLTVASLQRNQSGSSGAAKVGKLGAWVRLCLGMIIWTN